MSKKNLEEENKILKEALEYALNRFCHISNTCNYKGDAYQRKGLTLALKHTNNAIKKLRKFMGKVSWSDFYE